MSHLVVHVGGGGVVVLPDEHGVAVGHLAEGEGQVQGGNVISLSLRPFEDGGFRRISSVIDEYLN